MPHLVYVPLTWSKEVTEDNPILCRSGKHLSLLLRALRDASALPPGTSLGGGDHELVSGLEQLAERGG
jgi:hypothetical protein